MRIPHFVFITLATASVVTNAQPVHAFGGTARELEHQGNFAITNNAGFGFTHDVGHGDATVFSLRPALDYFVITHLSVGGAVEFRSQSHPGNAPTDTTFTVAPRVGYEIGLSDTWSFWLTLSTPLSLPNRGDPRFAIVVFAPFLIHPAQHFFFGIGPGFSQELTSNPATSITGDFVIGGYFDH